jgi:hypothetical protein
MTKSIEANLYVEIDGTFYRVSDPLGPAIRVRKRDSRVDYRVSATPGGHVTCTCGDYVNRHAGSADRCKHGEALVIAGLIDPSAEDVVEDLVEET